MLSDIVFYCVLLSGVFYSDSVNKYCNPNICAKDLQHTLCKFQPGPASHCLSYELLITSDKDKQLVLDKINARRDKVAAGEIKSLPPAEDMFKMVWNEELTESAQRWADQCVLNKDVGDVEDDCRDLESMQVGQNVATVYGEAPGLTPTALVDVWYLQLLNVNASVLSEYRPSNETGPSSYNQFTQLVWGASYQVGCGGVKFKEHSEDLEDKKERVVYRLVCNFAPQGNQLGRSVYTPGQAGAKCLHGTSNTYRALCNSQTPELHDNDTKDSDDAESEEENTTDNINDDEIATINNHTIDTTTLSAVDIYGDDNMTFDYFSHLFELTKEHFPTATTTEKPKCKNDLAVDEIVEIVKNKLSDDPALKAVFATTVPTTTGSIIKDEKVAAFLNKIYKKATSPSKPVTTSTDFVNSTLLVNLVEAVMFRNRDELKEKITEEIVTEPFVNHIKVQAVSAFKTSYDFTGHYFFPEYDGEETVEQTGETDYDIAARTSSLPNVVLEIEQIRKSKPTRDFIDEILETEPIVETTTRMKPLSPDDMKLPTSGYNNMRNFLKDIAENAENSDGMFTSLRKETNRFRRKKRRNKNISKHNIFKLDQHLCMITRFDERPVREHFKSQTSIRFKHCSEVETIISELEYDKDNLLRNKCVKLVPIGSISLLAVLNCLSYHIGHICTQNKHSL